jgi:hypothetical protein
MGAEAQSVPAATKLFNQANEILGYLQTSISIYTFFSSLLLLQYLFIVHKRSSFQRVVVMLKLSFLLVNLDMTCWIFAPMDQKKSLTQQ